MSGTGWLFAASANSPNWPKHRFYAILRYYAFTHGYLIYDWDCSPATIPSNPHTVYVHTGWKGMTHWLGTGNLIGSKQAFLPFKEAMLHARSLKLKTQLDWKAWCKSGRRPANIPARPDTVYKHEGWRGHGHWLGTKITIPP